MFKIKQKLLYLIKYIEFIKDFISFKKLNDNRFKLNWEDKKPILFEKTNKTEFDKHYVLHPAWAARIIKQINPAKHTDISSSLHFATMLSAFIETDFYDYRPANLNLKGLNTKSINLSSLPFPDNSIKSLSCMHVIEHIGLGRYGDSINPLGDVMAMKELERVVAKNSDLLFVVPIGKPKIMFNAHRIYAYEYILKIFKNLKLHSFSLIPDKKYYKNIINNPPRNIINKQNYGCGCFWFKKI